MSNLNTNFHPPKTRSAKLLAGTLFTLLLALSAHAALPFMSDSERGEKAEVIVTAQIDSIQDEGLMEIKRPSDGKVRAVLHTYSASMTVLSVEKGDLKSGDSLQVEYYQTADGPPGPQGQHELLPEDGDVRVFLRKVADSSRYELLQPNGWELLATP